MAGLLKEVMDRPERLRQSEVKLVRQRHIRNLLVRIAAERLGGEIVGYVVTFDDITELLSAQRKAAWSDIARRIAHEIKNPLTPIQLSAERLKRKYMKEIKTEPEVFSMCTDTIVRQVQDIGRMVDEFFFLRAHAPGDPEARKISSRFAARQYFWNATATPIFPSRSTFPTHPCA